VDQNALTATIASMSCAQFDPGSLAQNLSSHVASGAAPRCALEHDLDA
jgi:hypothetical protein